MNLNITYDANTLRNAPASFFSAMNYLINVFDTTFTNNLTVNIEVGYGTLPYDNSTVHPLAESYQNGLDLVSYTQAKQQLINMGAPGSTALPPSSPNAGALV